MALLSMPEPNNIKHHTFISDVEKRSTKFLIGILLLGLILRLIFTYGLADDFHYYNSIYEFNDTPSFTEGFINFWERGKYTHNTNHPDAAFGRLPGYPAFYGIHYVLFGKELSLPATALTQLLLDVLVIWLLYRIIKKISASETTALIGGLLYSAYPFAIYWNPYICTESLSCFIVVLWLHQLMYYNEKKIHQLLIGLICAAAFFIREYLGILIAITLITDLIFLRKDLKRFFNKASLTILGFIILYIGWPIRNYYQFERLVLVRPSSAGYENYSNDMVGYTLFYHCWSQDDNEWYDSLLTASSTIFPNDAFNSKKDQALGVELLEKMRTCGTSYKNWVYNTPYPKGANCNEEILIGFEYLRNEYIKQHPVTYFIVVPFRNLKKAFFKMQPEHSDEELKWVYHIAFSYRSLLVILGFAGLFYLKRYKQLTPVFLFSGFMYLYICFYYRSLEMRYILQADVLLLIPAIMTVHEVYLKFKSKKTLPVPQKVNSQT